MRAVVVVLFFLQLFHSVYIFNNTVIHIEGLKRVRGGEGWKTPNKRYALYEILSLKTPSVLVRCDTMFERQTIFM